MLAIKSLGTGFGQKLAMPVISTRRYDRPVHGRLVCRCCQLDIIAGARHDLAAVMRWSADSEDAH
jgi:hypothetical protein